MNKKIILITGGIGYIGSHGVVAFEQAGYKTVIVDNLSNSNINTLNGIENIIGYKPDFFEIDLREKDKLEEIFKKYNFDGVIHFAGLKSVGESFEKPLKYFDNNIIGSLRLFELMDKYAVKNIIFSSSATVYNSNNKVPFIETNIVGETTNPYGTTKFLLEKILEDLSKFSKFNVVNLRYFNPIGAHKSGEIGENPEGIPNNLLPYIMKVAIGELEELKIFGGDYNTIDGTGIRDYIDVVDLIEGHLKAYEKMTSPQPSPLEEREQEKFRKTSPQPSPLEEREQEHFKKTLHQFSLLEERKQGIFETFNLGVGKGVSVLEMIDLVRKITGKEIPFEIVDRRDGDLAEVYCDSFKAYNILGFKVKTSLEESLKNSWRFYNK